ncbi:MAG: hypothetical protein HY814_06760 [Candidatus Riflebacteria bacterium]|nr:hypothetical protein [Candidatus Riflebacteria bacterium]
MVVLRSLALTLLALTLIVGPQPSFAQTSSGSGDGDAYGDLIRGNVAGRAERVVYERTEIEPVLELTPGSLTGILDKLSGELTEVEGLIEKLRSSGYMEESGGWGTRNIRLRTPAAFDSANALGKSLLAKLTIVKAEVVRVSSYFADRRQNLDEVARKELSSAFGRVTEMVTRYNVAAKFASSYRIRYETPMPFDEKQSLIEKDGRTPLPFPQMPAAFVAGHQRLETSVQDVDDGHGTRVRRVERRVEQTVVVPTPVLLGKSVSTTVPRARQMLDQAHAARIALESAGTVESHYVTLTDKAAYERLVPTVVKFQTSMVRGLACLNAVSAGIDGAQARLADIDARGVIAELNTRFQDLAGWGATRVFRYNTRMPLDERVFYLLPLGFPRDFTYAVSLPVSSGSPDPGIGQDFGRGTGDGNLPAGLGQGPTGPGRTMTPSDLMALVRASGNSSSRESVLLQNVHLVQGLTPQTLVEAARWLGNTDAKLRLFNTGLDVIRRRLQGQQGPLTASPVRSSEITEMACYLGNTDAKQDLFVRNLDLISNLDSYSLIEMGRYLGTTNAKLTLFKAGFEQLRRRRARGIVDTWPLTTAGLYEMGLYLGNTDAKQDLFVTGMYLVSDLSPTGIEKLNAQLGNSNARAVVLNAGLDEMRRNPRFGR